jgi:glycosyltransferase involved in cell wall biosynthesis
MQANELAGRRAVVLVGELDDPRPVYAAADIFLGMGGSVLRAMAFEKPVIVQGEIGFWELLTPQTVETFLWTGWYGIGKGTSEGPIRLKAAMEKLLRGPDARAELGRFGRRIVNSQYSLDKAAAAQAAIYEKLIASRSDFRFRPSSDLTAMTRLAVHTLKRQVQKRLGGKTSEDFNAKPVAMSSKEVFTESNRPLVMWLAGASWDGHDGTEKRMVEALTKHVRVLWIDPPRSWWKLRRRQIPRQPIGPARVADDVLRLSIMGPPATTRIVFRSITQRLVAHQATKVAAELGELAAVVVANPLLTFPKISAVSRIYFVTDDWISGAPLMGLSPRSVRRAEARNFANASAVIAVSPTLAEELQRRHGTRIHTVPNGATLHEQGTTHIFDPGLAGPIAGVVGTINERIDLELLEAVADKGLNLILVGPRKDHDQKFSARFNLLTSRANVRWHKAQPTSVIPAILDSLAVGLTPYADNAFNRASFPLKTLEYLGAGLPCVAMQSPATDWLDTDLIDTANSADEFSHLVAERMVQPADDIARTERIAFAVSHSWPVRAKRFLNFMQLQSVRGR